MRVVAGVRCVATVVVWMRACKCGKGCGAIWWGMSGCACVLGVRRRCWGVVGVMAVMAEAAVAAVCVCVCVWWVCGRVACVVLVALVYLHRGCAC